MDPNVIYTPERLMQYEDSLSIGHLIIENLTKANDKVMIVSGITQEELTAKDLLSKSIAVAKALIASGVKPGDVVALVSENRIEFPYILCGILLLNCTCAPINLTYSEREMAHAFNLSKPKIIFTTSFASESVVNVAASLKYLKKLVLIDDENIFGDKVELLNDFLNSPESKAAAFAPKATDKKKTVSVILCSSGTTGLPKGVQLSQDNLIVVARFSKNTVLKLSTLEDDEPVILGLLPWFHAFGLTSLMGVIASITGKIVLLPKFEESWFLGCIENYRCNVVFMVPPLMVFLAKNPVVDDYDLKSLRIIICGAAPLSKELEQAVYDRLKNPKLRIHQGYGMSELSLATHLQTNFFKRGSIGGVVEGSIAKVIDENGKSLGPNQRGELCMKGNQLMIGYIGDDEATKGTIDNDGWLHTGDAAYYDEDKQFYIVDRIKELIKWKGYQVPPEEISGLLLTHPKVKDVAVIGIPDEIAGELPFAFVVRADESLSEKEVIRYVAERASPPKRLHGGVKFIEEIPRNLSGKILRRELRKLLDTNLKSKL